MLTEKECKKILFNLGIELGVSPNLISTRLLDDYDKSNMMTVDFSIESLRAHIEVWRDSGMPDYANGKPCSLYVKK
jgi:hypothetical protein